MEDVRAGKYAIKKSNKLRGEQAGFGFDAETTSAPVPLRKVELLPREDSSENSIEKDGVGARYYRLESPLDSYDPHVASAFGKFLSEKWTEDASGIGIFAPISTETVETISESRTFPDGIGAFIVGGTVYGARHNGTKWEPFGKEENRALMKTVSEFPQAGIIPYFPELVIV